VGVSLWGWSVCRWWTAQNFQFREHKSKNIGRSWRQWSNASTLLISIVPSMKPNTQLVRWLEHSFSYFPCFDDNIFCQLKIWHRNLLTKIYILLRFVLPTGAAVAQAVYGLDDWAIEVRSPTEVEDFSSSPASRPALGPTQPPTNGYRGFFPRGVKRGRGVTLTTHPHLVPRLRMSRSYTSSPPMCLHGV
jgi:hypothetical protein